MKEIYRLDQDSITNIPCLHDCVIKQIKLDKEYLTFIFDNDLTSNDSFNHYQKDYKSVIIKYHLIDEIDVYFEKINITPILKSFKQKYVLVSNNKLLKLINKKYELVYLYNYLRYQSLIINLWAGYNIILNISSDYVEYEWI